MAAVPGDNQTVPPQPHDSWKVFTQNAAIQYPWKYAKGLFEKLQIIIKNPQECVVDNEKMDAYYCYSIHGYRITFNISTVKSIPTNAR